MKLTKRKGFNFFRSYWDVYNELEDSDKLAFIDALLNKQFLGVNPENLTGMAKFAYISQTNSIDTQTKGFESKMKDLNGENYNPYLGGCEPPVYGGNLPPAKQEEGKGEEEVQVKEKEKGEEKGEGKSKIHLTPDSIYPLETVIENYLKNDKVIDAVLKHKENGFKNRKHLEEKIKEFEQFLLQGGESVKSPKDFASHFRNWNKTKKSKEIPFRRDSHLQGIL